MFEKLPATAEVKELTIHNVDLIEKLFKFIYN